MGRIYHIKRVSPVKLAAPGHRRDHEGGRGGEKVVGVFVPSDGLWRART